MKVENSLIIMATLWNLGLIGLSLFCCWYFNTMWGLLPLVFVKGYEFKTKSDNNQTESEGSD
jgi:hypothetical protein